MVLSGFSYLCLIVVVFVCVGALVDIELLDSAHDVRCPVTSPLPLGGDILGHQPPGDVLGVGPGLTGSLPTGGLLGSLLGSATSTAQFITRNKNGILVCSVLRDVLPFNPARTRTSCCPSVVHCVEEYS